MAIIVGLDVPVGSDLAWAFDPVARQLTGGPVLFYLKWPV